MSDDTLSTDELVEYCRTQAGLLSGRVETIGAETDDLLDEIDDEIAEIRTRLQAHDRGSEPRQPSATGPTDAEGELAELEALEAELEEKQAIAEAKQARQAAFQDLAGAYVELAEELTSGVADGAAALERVVRFERARDVPAYFDDRRTVLEAVAESDDSAAE